ncbi:cytochrome c oxidase subunit 7A2, mitochondrial-like [Asterias rubens]|uniref:cytochrome c oxidase subunit 7A2, mitochondrial-like n=1 Tax=Asterias rubens TaxID=7604 RepID=UPI0014555EDB|nr:cytochrome c oxidase subunit 7A2, mitochondrial-like [Asterias rubens]
MNRVLMLRSLVPQARLNFSTSVRSQLESKIKEGQSKFQSDNGLPIHLKGGGFDTFTYATIMGLTVVGTALTCYSLFDYSMPKK